jgi:hypothetical protein
VLSWVGGNESFANWAVCLAWHRKSCGVGGSAAAAGGGGGAAAAVVVAAVVGDTVLCVVQLEEDAKRPSHYFGRMECECTCWYPTAWSAPRTGVWLTCLVVVDAPHGVCLLGQWCLSGALGGHVFQLPFCEIVLLLSLHMRRLAPPEVIPFLRRESLRTTVG